MSFSSNKRESVYRIINFFYPEYNPFNGEFGASSVNQSVYEVVTSMLEEFDQCIKISAPLVIFESMSNVGGRKTVDFIQTANALWSIADDPEHVSIKGCRSTIASVYRTELYKAFSRMW